MNVFGDSPTPGPDELLAGLDEDTCAWCVQLRDADALAGPTPTAGTGRTPTAGRRPPAPWMVPLGLPPRPAQTDR